MAAAPSRIQLDLNSPEFQEALFRLEAEELKQVVAALRRLRTLDWNGLYRHPGFRWERIETLRAADGATVYSIRLSQRIRAIGLRQGEWLRLVSLEAPTTPRAPTAPLGSSSAGS